MTFLTQNLQKNTFCGWLKTVFSLLIKTPRRSINSSLLAGQVPLSDVGLQTQVLAKRCGLVPFPCRKKRGNDNHMIWCFCLGGRFETTCISSNWSLQVAFFVFKYSPHFCWSFLCCFRGVFRSSHGTSDKWLAAREWSEVRNGQEHAHSIHVWYIYVHLP